MRRQQVAYARVRGLSGRRACAILSVARSTLGYQSRLVTRDAPALAAMHRLAAQYPPLLAAAVNWTVVAGENLTVGGPLWLPAGDLAPGR